jgi:hypothetical protein
VDSRFRGNDGEGPGDCGLKGVTLQADSISAACFSFFKFPLQSFDLREQEREAHLYSVPDNPVVHQVVPVDEHISEPHDALLLAQPGGGFRIVAPQAPDRLANDLKVPLYGLTQ